MSANFLDLVGPAHFSCELHSVAEHTSLCEADFMLLAAALALGHDKPTICEYINLTAI
jgi:hypothetical protein